MKNYIIRWWKGYNKICISGDATEKFMNSCRKKGCSLWGIHHIEKDEIILFAPGKQQKLMEDIAKEHKIICIVQNSYGFKEFIKYIYRRRSVSLGIMMCFVFVILLSTRLWRIEIQGNSYYTKQYLEKQLEGLDIYPGVSMRDILCNEVESRLRNALPYLSWISVKKNGSVLSLQVEEGDFDVNKQKKKKADLIADTNGRVISIVVNKGQKMVHKGDNVKKGDVLISGQIPIIGDDQIPESYQYVHSSGNVMIQGRQKLIIKKRIKQDKMKQGDVAKEGYKIHIAGKILFLHNPFNQLEKVKKYDIISECDLTDSDLSVYLPIKVEHIQYRPVIHCNITATESQLQQICRKDFAEYLVKREKAGWQIKKIKKSVYMGKKYYKQVYNITYWKKQKKRKTISKGRELIHGDNGDSH